MVWARVWVLGVASGGARMSKPSRTRSIGTKVTAEEYGRLEACASDSRMSISEWSREALLAAANLGRRSTGEQAILAEIIALRTIVVNLIYAFTSEGKVTAEQMRAFIQRADGTKSKRAMELLAQIGRAGKPDAADKTPSAEEAH
jgi:predicted RNA-binding Zn ribbon-like protein